MEKLYAVFDLGHESFGICISEIDNIIKMQPIIPLPHAPVFIEGITNLRGRVLPVMDLRKRFGLATQPGSPSNRIIVARLGGVDLGMLVDGVSEVLTIPDEWIEPPRPAGLAGANGLIGMAKISERTVTLLDLGKFLTAKERSGLLNLQKVIEA